MSEERIRLNISDQVAEVRLMRAEKHNALDSEMCLQLNATSDELMSRKDVRAVVLCADGPSFCAGLDLASFMGGGLSLDDIFSLREGDIANTAQRMAYAWKALPMPVIAALHGVCYGGGCQIALCPDIRIAAADTRLSVMEIKYGLIPDMAITQSLPQLVGLDVAKELTYTGRIVEAEEALRLGLITRIADDPYAEAMELAGQIAARSPHAIRDIKRLYDESWKAEPAVGLKLEADLQKNLLGSPNQMKAVQAAMTKQAAVFDDPS
ncbi:MAG: crotonase/enoyl-CoA hydratase family protein [Nevskiales bacterium]